MKKTALILTALLSLSLCWTLSAKVTLPSVISDNMVLQQQTDAAIWGTAAAGARISVKESWFGKKYNTKADAQGKWLVRIATPQAGGPYTITISDGEAITLKNVLIGEVWFCSGQSNMEMPMKGYDAQPVEGSAEYIIKAKKSTPIRICTIQRASSTSIMDKTTGSWQEHSPEVVANTSATAYFFAEELQSVLDVPVGILISCWGGSSIETWLSREVIEANYQELGTAHLDGKAAVKFKHQDPCLLYNGMVAALEPYSFKGMIWYQGETNRATPQLYLRMQQDYVKMMREKFDAPKAPFYCVQIAPFNYDDDDWTSGYFYEAQQKSVEGLEGCGFVSTCDLGSYNTIHPPYKQAIGRRLAYKALRHDYGHTELAADAPTYEKVEFAEGRAYVHFKTDNLGLAPMRQDLTGFEIAGKNKIFYPAQARMQYDRKGTKVITVWSPDVTGPVAVRYCFRNWCKGDLYNCAGIAAAPFRTDDWDL